MTHELPAMTLLGPLALRKGTVRQKLPFAGHTKRLFVFLCGHANVGVRREALIDELWSDVPSKRAQSGLNTAIWRIKQGVNQFEGFAIQTVDDLVRLAVDPPAQIDSHALETALAQVSSVPRLSVVDYDRLATAVSLCRGPFLDGCSDHWVLPLREKFLALHIRALTLLMRDRAACGQYDAALEYGRAILALDCFREGTQREVMWLYALNGQRARAIAQYRELALLLEQELGIDPMPETMALYRKIAHAADPIARLAALSVDESGADTSTVPAVCLQHAQGDRAKT